MMISMLTPLNATIMHVILCMAGGALFSVGLGAVSNIILKKTSLATGSPDPTGGQGPSWRERGAGFGREVSLRRAGGQRAPALGPGQCLAPRSEGPQATGLSCWRRESSGNAWNFLCIPYFAHNHLELFVVMQKI